MRGENYLFSSQLYLQCWHSIYLLTFVEWFKTGAGNCSVLVQGGVCSTVSTEVSAVMCQGNGLKIHMLKS